MSVNPCCFVYCLVCRNMILMSYGTLVLRKGSYSLMIFESNLESLALAKISGVYLKVNLVWVGLFPPPPPMVALSGARDPEMLCN